MTDCYVATGVRRTRWVPGTRNHHPSGGAHRLGILTCLLLEGKWQAESLLGSQRCQQSHQERSLQDPNYWRDHTSTGRKQEVYQGQWNTSYLCIVLDYESSLLTTFNTPWGRYRFVCLPWGLSCAQDIFQRMMDQILEKCKGVIGIANDVVIYGDDDEDHNWNLHNFMCRAREHGIVFNGEKCEVKKDSVTFFRMVYNANGAHPDPKKVDATHKMPPPDSKLQC